MSKNYRDVTIQERVGFLSHSAAELVQTMYYGRDVKGLEVLIKNFESVLEHARNCLSCLEILGQGGDVYSKIYMLLDYLGQEGMTEEFVYGLEDLTEHAQECLGGEVSKEAEAAALRNMRKLMSRNAAEYQLFSSEEIPFSDILNGKAEVISC